MIARALDDDRGAMMVLALMMAMLLTAALYHLIGIGEAIDQRETMQDAADAGAFSAAVLHARGMNLIALINVVMAALLAILVALKLLEAVLTIAILLLVAAAFFSGGTTLEAIPAVNEARQSARDTHAQLRPTIHQTLETLRSTARGVRAVVPWTAQLRVLGVMRRHGPYARGGFVLPASTALATKDGRFSELCTEAGAYVGETAELAIPDLPGGVDGDVGDALEELAGAGAGWFCGADGASPPKTTVTERRTLPTLPERERCEHYPAGGPSYDPGEQATLCEAAVRAEVLSAPDPATGECQSDACHARAALARKACKPGLDAARFNWMYQRRTVLKKWGYRANSQGGTWRFITAEPREGPVLVTPDPEREDRRPPCGLDTAVVAPDWNEARGEATSPTPVCEEVPSFPPVRPGTPSAYHEQPVTQVTDVFACVLVAEREIDVGDLVDDDHLDEGNGTARAPQVVADADLGGERYQVRAVALGSLPRAAPERVVEVASWGRPPQGSLLLSAASLGRLAVAQAEYFYAVEDPEAPDPSRWLWNMRWSARLRRFRLPETETRGDLDADEAAQWGVGEIGGDLGEACNEHGLNAIVGDATGDRCESMLGDLDSLESLVLH